jgi:hypothetical protein
MELSPKEAHILMIQQENSSVFCDFMSEKQSLAKSMA